ncbi:MAG: NlpC/P60 family protein [Desulforhopalus sp.]
MVHDADRYRATIAFFIFSLTGLLLYGCSEKESYPPVRELALRAVTDLSDETAVEAALNRYFANWQGVPYRYGGTSKNGVDCSGFVQQTYSSQFGIDLPRTTRKMSRSGKKISGDKLKPGDLLFFKIGWFERHVGIFLHEHHFIHVSTRKGVMMSSLDDFYWKDRFWQARRIFN